MDPRSERQRDTETQRHRDRDTKTQRHRDTETQRHRDSHTHTRITTLKKATTGLKKPLISPVLRWQVQEQAAVRLGGGGNGPVSRAPAPAGANRRSAQLQRNR
eukprot:872510-Rhodomonas_salina.1